MLKICRTCLEDITEVNFVNLDSHMKSKLSICVPEMILNLITDATICMPCVGALESAFSFRTRCLSTEKHIENYVQSNKLETSGILLADLYTWSKESTTQFNRESKSEFVKSPCGTVDLNNEKLGEIENRAIDVTTNHVLCNSIDGKPQAVETVEQQQPPPASEKTNKSEENLSVKFKKIFTLKKHSNGMLLTCSACEYSTTQKSELKKHLLGTHTGKNLHSCEVCCRKFINKQDLLRHMKTHTDEKPFRCNICDFATKRKDSLISHVRIHSGEKPFACNTCKFTTAHKKRLVIHSRIHSAEKQFVCGVCEFSTVHKNSFIYHLRTHTGEKPFVCDVCDLKFTKKSNLTRHKKVHGKVFACAVCKFSSASKKSLSEHKIVHCNKKSFTCHTCGCTTSNKINLIIHMRVHRSE